MDLDFRLSHVGSVTWINQFNQPIISIIINLLFPMLENLSPPDYVMDINLLLVWATSQT